MKLLSDGWLTAIFVGIGLAFVATGAYYGIVVEEWAHGTFNLLVGYLVLEEV